MNIRRYVIVGFIIIVAVSIGFLINNTLNPSGTLVLSIAPEEGTLIVDGKERRVKNDDTIGLSAGDHSIIFKRDEFKDSESTNVTIRKGEDTRLIIVLEPLTDAARELLRTAGAQSVREENGGQEIINYTNETLDKNPILNVLPITSRLYIISSCQSQKFPDDPDKIALCVESSGEHDLAPYVQKDISSRGYNPDDFEIIYVHAFEGDHDH